MFGLWKKVIDDKTLRHYCGALTGAVPTSKPYGRDKRRRQHLPQSWGSDIRDGVKRILLYELVFDYDGKDPEDEELIELEFIEYYHKDSNQIHMGLDRVTDSANLRITMTEGGLDILIGRGKLTQLDVEMAVDVAKWMVATGMGNGRVMANDVISRKNFTPRGVV